MITEAGLTAVGDIRRDDIEDYKVWLAARPRAGGRTITTKTQRQRLRTVRQFFERIIEWDWPDAPPRNPIIAGDIPNKPEPLPKFLDDRDAARLMAAARASTDPRDRLVVELLARTGMRAGELSDLDADAVVQIGAAALAARPARQAPQRPLRPAAPRPRRPARRAGPPPTSSTSAATSGSSPTPRTRSTGT